MDETQPRTLSDKRRRAAERIAAYLDSLPSCTMKEYGPEEQAEHEQAQRRILDLCAEDRGALVEFLVGFFCWAMDFRKRVERKEDGRLYLMPEGMEPTLLSPDLPPPEAEAISALLTCPCAGCVFARAAAAKSFEGTGAAPDFLAIARAATKDKPS